MNTITNLNEQLIGKFHVTNVDKLVNSDENIQQQDETGCASRFQMIRVDKNFGREKWKANDCEPSETILNSTNSNENETTTTGESNVTPTATQFQRRFSVNGPLPIVPTATGILHPYTAAAGTIPNQSYLLSNHPPQFGYYPFYPPPYSPYAPPWPAALPPTNPYLQGPSLPPPPPNLPQISTTLNQSDLSQISDKAMSKNGDNTYPNDLHLSAYLYALQQAHSPYLPQTSSSISAYATIPSYHPIAPAHPTILPSKTLPSSQTNNPNHHSNDTTQQMPFLNSPKSIDTKSLLQSSSLITPKTKSSLPVISNEINRTNHIPDLISSSPAPPSLISPLIVSSTTSLNDMWTYATAGSPLNLQQTAATAVATMELLNTKTNSNNEITNEFFKELTTPIKPNNTTDIDNKISAAMVKHKCFVFYGLKRTFSFFRIWSKCIFYQLYAKKSLTFANRFVYSTKKSLISNMKMSFFVNMFLPISMLNIFHFTMDFLYLQMIQHLVILIQQTIRCKIIQS